MFASRPKRTTIILSVTFAVTFAVVFTVATLTGCSALEDPAQIQGRAEQSRQVAEALGQLSSRLADANIVDANDADQVQALTKMLADVARQVGVGDYTDGDQWANVIEGAGQVNQAIPHPYQAIAGMGLAVAGSLYGAYRGFKRSNQSALQAAQIQQSFDEVVTGFSDAQKAGLFEMTPGLKTTLNAAQSIQTRARVDQVPAKA